MRDRTMQLHPAGSARLRHALLIAGASVLAALLVAGSVEGAVSPTPSQSIGTGYYVDSSAGSDANDGTSPSTPWRTLAKASTAALQPGDSLNFARGGSWKGTLTVNSSGTATSPITIQPYGSGPNPVIFQVRTNGSDTVVLNGSYLVIKEFVLHDAHEAGVEINGNFDTVQDNEMYADGWGVRFFGSDNRVIGNYIHDLQMVVNDHAANNDYGAAGLVIWGGADRQEIAYNRIEDCKAPSVDYGTDGGVVEFWQNSDGHNIHHNYASGNNGGFEVGGGVVSNTLFHHNLLVNNGGVTGIHWGGSFAAGVVNYRFENNTIIEGSEWGLFSFWEGSPPDASRVIVRNNVIRAASGGGVYSSPFFTHEHNVYAPGAYLGDEIALGPGEQVADPLFVNLSAGDYHLLAGSPAIDRGLDLGYTLDYDGSSIPAGSGSDVGAYEYGSSPPASTATASPTAERTPTPTSVPPGLQKPKKRR